MWDFKEPVFHSGLLRAFGVQGQRDFKVWSFGGETGTCLASLILLREEGFSMLTLPLHLLTLA